MSRAVGQPATTPLLLRIGPDSGAGHVATAMSSLLQEIDQVLVPIVGTRGVSALFRRSIHLASRSHGWLLAGRDDPSDLLALLAGHDAADAAEGAQAYLHEFHGLLVDLIGQALTARLLSSVGTPDSIRPAPQVSP